MSCILVKYYKKGFRELEKMSFRIPANQGKKPESYD